MKLGRDRAIETLIYLNGQSKFYFPFKIMCKGFCGDDDFVEILPSEIDEINMIVDNEEYQDFELWEDLQNNDQYTTALISYGYFALMEDDQFDFCKYGKFDDD